MRIPRLGMRGSLAKPLLMNALGTASHTIFQSGDSSAAKLLFDELVAIAEDQDSLAWKPTGTALQGFALTEMDKHSDAVEKITLALAAYKLTGATVGMPHALCYLGHAYAGLGKYGDARHCIEEAIVMAQTTDEKWCEGEINRIAGTISIGSHTSDESEAERYLERALAVARQQQAKSWELRAAMSMARLWRGQGKPQQAHKLLAPVYDWFTEGFDTLDLKEAKALLEELAA
jgi:predicted ATPase